MKRKNWTLMLLADAELTLKETGRLLKEARKRRGLSIAELARRASVDQRRISELEKGSPGVSIGIFIQVISLLGLTRGFSELLKPENDISQAALNLRSKRKNKKANPSIPDDEVNF